jgi:hypothetical protein
MVMIHTKKGDFVTRVRRKAVRLRDGGIVEGAVVGARALLHREGGFWFLEETVREDGGAEHRCHLRSDSVRESSTDLSKGALLRSLRHEGNPPSFLLKFDDEESASRAARAINAAARAYAEGRIAISVLPARNGPTTFHGRMDGVKGITHLSPDRSAVEWAEDAAVRHPKARITVEEREGVTPRLPFRSCLDDADVRTWMRANLRVGMILILEETHYGIVRHAPVRVTKPLDGRGRFFVDLPEMAAISYGKVTVTGKFDEAPTGQSRVIPPFREAVAAVSARDSARFYRGDRTAAMLDELSRQEPVEWTRFLRWDPGPGFLATPLEEELNPRPRPELKVPPTATPAKEASEQCSEDGEEESEGEEPSAHEDTVGYADLRGSKLQVRYAPSVLAAFINARGLDRSDAVATDDDELVLGCADAGMLLDHADTLRRGDPAAFVETLGATWESFAGVDGYRASPSLVGNSTRSKAPIHWHTMTVNGREFAFEAISGKRWAFKTDSGRFAWVKRDGRRHVLPGTLVTKDKGGKPVVRGDRRSRPPMRP